MTSRTELTLTTRPTAMHVTEFHSPEDLCSYLPQEVSSLKYRQILAMEPDEYDGYLQRGWRRHGIAFFRPDCPTCAKCQSLRVLVRELRMSKSQRRCWKRNSDVQLRVIRPQLTADHLRLFNHYHADMHDRRGWPFQPCDAQQYAASFLIGDFSFAHEFQYWRNQQLVGVGLVDLTDHAASSIYFYHAPEWRKDGPGTYSMLAELQFAASRGVRHHYLGYWIAQCQSMAYKSNYRPHEILVDYVPDDQRPRWRRPTSGNSSPLTQSTSVRQ